MRKSLFHWKYFRWKRACFLFFFPSWEPKDKTDLPLHKWHSILFNLNNYLISNMLTTSINLTSFSKINFCHLIHQSSAHFNLSRNFGIWCNSMQRDNFYRHNSKRIYWRSISYTSSLPKDYNNNIMWLFQYVLISVNSLIPLITIETSSVTHILVLKYQKC